jgi:protein-tyrosine phosphatase
VPLALGQRQTREHAVVMLQEAGFAVAPQYQDSEEPKGTVIGMEPPIDFMKRLFVDCHSHVCPSDDDGASDVAEGAVLCNNAAVHGSRILFATPHVWPHLTLTPEREHRVRNAFKELQARSTIELRLGFELTPDMPLLEEDPRRYELGGTGCVLMEVPFMGKTVLLRRLAQHAEAYGLTPVIAHPERSNAILADYEEAVDMAHRGWLLQVNATSITGHDGPAVQALAWRLIDDGHASLVASDGHREARPARIDTAWEQVCARMGEKARRLFDGTALGIVRQ